MRSMAVEGQLYINGTWASLKHGLLRCSRWAWLAVLVVAMMAPLGRKGAAFRKGTDFRHGRG
jgi:hypothetical protein